MKRVLKTEIMEEVKAAPGYEYLNTPEYKEWSSMFVGDYQELHPELEGLVITYDDEFVVFG